MSKNRIEAFTDAVIAIVMTLLVAAFTIFANKGFKSKED